MGKDDKPRYLSARSIAKLYDISSKTLRNWAEAGKLNCLRYCDAGATSTQNSRRLYDVEQLAALLQDDATAHKLRKERAKEKIAYARVSSASQKADLERQITDLKRERPGHRIISDVGSGLNFKRTGLRALVDAIYTGNVEEVVVMHKDRLCRYGVELIECMLERAGAKLVVLDRDNDGVYAAEGGTAELADDLLAVTTFFVARHNGRRAAQKRKERSDAGKKEDSELQAKKRRGAATAGDGKNDAKEDRGPAIQDGHEADTPPNKEASKGSQ